MNGIPEESPTKQRFLKAKEAAAFFGVSQDTLRRWNAIGLISAFKTNPVGGHRRYDIKSYKEPVGSIKLSGQTEQPSPTTIIPATVSTTVQTDNRYSVCYARVSSAQQKDDLERQVESLKSSYPSYEIIKDVGSGVNFKRRGFQQLLKKVFNGDVKEIVIAHRDRLCRFGFDLLQWIFDYHHTKLVVLDTSEEDDPSRDLCKDVLSILHVFACRIHGKRKYSKERGGTKRRTEEDDERETEEESKDKS